MPLELIDRITALVPPPRMHRHRYYGVLARGFLMAGRSAILRLMRVEFPIRVTVRAVRQVVQ